MFFISVDNNFNGSRYWSKNLSVNIKIIKCTYFFILEE